MSHRRGHFRGECSPLGVHRRWGPDPTSHRHGRRQGAQSPWQQRWLAWHCAPRHRTQAHHRTPHDARSSGCCHGESSRHPPTGLLDVLPCFCLPLLRAQPLQHQPLRPQGRPSAGPAAAPHPCAVHMALSALSTEARRAHRSHALAYPQHVAMHAHRKHDGLRASRPHSHLPQHASERLWLSMAQLILCH